MANAYKEGLVPANFGETFRNSPMWRTPEHILRGVAETPKLVSGKKPGSHVYVDWYGQSPRLLERRKFLFPLKGNAPLSTELDRLYTPFIGRTKRTSEGTECLEDYPDPHDFQSYLRWSAQREFGMIATTTDLMMSHDMSYIRYGLGVESINDPELGIVTPKFFYHPEIQARVDNATTFKHRLNNWLGGGGVRASGQRVTLLTK